METPDNPALRELQGVNSELRQLRGEVAQALRLQRWSLFIQAASSALALAIMLAVTAVMLFSQS